MADPLMQAPPAQKPILPVGGTAAASTAQASVEEQKKALLQVLAEQGQAGRSAYDQAQQAVQAQKAAGLQAALGRASQIAAPDAYIQGQQQYASQPYDNTLSSLSSGKATFDADMARSTARDSSYFDKVGAAIPLAQAQTDAEMAKLYTDADQSNQDRQQSMTDALLQRIAQEKQRQFDLQQQEFQKEQAALAAKRAEEAHGWDVEQHGWDVEDRQLQLAIAQQNLARSRSGGGSGGGGGGRSYAGAGTPLADLVHGLGGQTSAKAQLAPSVKQVFSQMQSQVKAKAPLKGLAGNRTTSGARTPFSQVAAMSKSDIMNQIGASLGLGDGVLEQFLGKQSPTYVPPKKGPSAKQASEAQKLTSRTTKTYKTTAPKIVERFKTLTTGKNKISVTQAKQQMISDIRTSKDYKNHPNVYEQLILDILAR